MWNEKIIFSDPSIQAEVWENGFAKRSLMSAAEAASLLEEIRNIADERGHSFETLTKGEWSWHQPEGTSDKEYRRQIDTLLRSRLEDQTKSFLRGYRLMHSSIIVKPPGEGKFLMHADTSLHMQFDWPSISFWCPLTPVSIANGTLSFIPGSHQVFRQPIIHNFAQYYPTQRVLDKLGIPIDLDAGETLIFDPSILHGSPNNATEEPRVAVVLGFIPDHSQAAHFYMDPEDNSRAKAMKFDGAERTEYSVLDVNAGNVWTEFLGSVPLNLLQPNLSEMIEVLKNRKAIREQRISLEDVVLAHQNGNYNPMQKPYIDRQIFSDESAQQKFEKDGYFTQSIMSADEAHGLLQEIVSIGSESNYGPNPDLGDLITYHMTDLDTDVSHKQTISDLAFERLSPVIDDLMIDYRLLTASMFVKPPKSGEIVVHNDWTVQEDNSEPTVYIWLPLADVPEECGPVRILAGSHGVLDFLHGPGTQAAYLGSEHALMPEMVTIPVKAGEALIFDAGALHHSFPNTTDKPRFALRLACIPKDRKGVLHKQSADDPDIIEMYSMERDETAAITGSDLLAGNFKTKLLGKNINTHLKLSADEIRMLVREGDRIRAGETTMMAELEKYRAEMAVASQSGDVSSSNDLGQRKNPYRLARKYAGKGLRFAKRILRKVQNQPFPVSDHPYSQNSNTENKAEDCAIIVETKDVRPHGGKDFTPYPRSDKVWEPFGNEQIDSALRTEGYATVPFLSAAEVDALAAAVSDAEKAHDSRNVHIDTRFQLSAFNNDAAYKERVFNNVWNCLKERTEALIPGYEPLVINVFDKPVSEAYDAVPIHQNPSFVSEPHSRSISLWVPFDDVDKQNGAVGVLPGSHGRFNAMRSGNMAHEDIFADVQTRLEEEAFVPVEMRKGELLALDDSIVHWSYPNVSDRPRKAVQLIMVPVGVPHIYYYYDEESGGEPMMDLYEVDHRFFFGFNCKARPEGLKHIDRVPYAYRKIRPDELFDRAENHKEASETRFAMEGTG